MQGIYKNVKERIWLEDIPLFNEYFVGCGVCMCSFPLNDHNTGWDSKCYTKQYKDHCDGHRYIFYCFFITLLTGFHITTLVALRVYSLWKYITFMETKEVRFG